MSSVVISPTPSTAALPQAARVAFSSVQMLWSVVFAIGAVIIGVTTLSFTLAHIGMNSLAFHFSAIGQNLSKYCSKG
ncbi:MAG TPA: hypothetical protein VKW78_08760 [Terriglobales bacterium]|nr:hypothetical protein [Terriglobales bacterium]